MQQHDQQQQQHNQQQQQQHDQQQQQQRQLQQLRNEVESSTLHFSWEVVGDETDAPAPAMQQQQQAGAVAIAQAQQNGAAAAANSSDIGESSSHGGQGGDDSAGQRALELTYGKRVRYEFVRLETHEDGRYVWSTQHT
jgi:hypothetical protein